MTNLCSNEHSKMSFELLETIQVTQKDLPPKLANVMLKAQKRSTYPRMSITQSHYASEDRKTATRTNYLL